MKVIVGLGNPGSEYERTRHNVGFRVVRELALRHGAGSVRSRFEAEVAEVFVAEQKTLLIAPQTFMNCSGRSVGRFVDFHNLPLDDLLVVCDDMNLPTGRVRLRARGSAGGQKGMKDIIDSLGSEQFARLRIGIDRPPGRMDATAWVLGRIRPHEKADIEHAVVCAADAAELWISEGVQNAMNRVNSAAADED